ncbi:tetratricopeptide repeat protein [Catellatospora methionotrophica]|uniref:tetratricopeptide repeat protein n=1 Tax=Catellatospora methionotrophica TaxID=121620 RepID=UPI0033EA78B8
MTETGPNLRPLVGELPAPATVGLALLAAWSGPDIDPHAVAAMLDLDPPTAAGLLRQLADRHLIFERSPGRFGLRTPARAFAVAHLLPTVPAPGRRAALRRLAAYYLHGAEHADTFITPHRHRASPGAVAAGPGPRPASDYDTALNWLTVEQANLAHVCVTCGEQGLEQYCWQLADALRGFYYLTKPWAVWLRINTAALRAAQRRGDAVAEMNAGNGLGLVHLELGQLDQAEASYRHALDRANHAGEAAGAATARANAAWVEFSRGHYERFLQEIQQSYDYYVRTGARRNASITLRGIGLAEGELGRLEDAVTHLSAALETFVALDLRLDATMTLNALGDAYRRARDDTNAVLAYHRALEAAERCGSRYEHGRAHHRLAELALLRQDTGTAARHLRRAAADYAVLAAQAQRVTSLLTSL